MEPSELEKELEELETRIERVRGLYEAYFLGMERLEPSIPRRDVDRRIGGIRKMQIRNTAMRFRFQTLAQRYNTLQQYWGRTVREIENGTYRRDVIRAAARFGDDALKGLGKRRAKALMGSIAVTQPREREKDVIELDENDVEIDVEDMDWQDEPTPPPLAPKVVEDRSGSYQWASPPDPATGPAADGDANRDESPSAARKPGFGQIDHDFAADLPEDDDSAAAPGRPKKGFGGLRWGAGPSQATDKEAIKRRLAELAAKVGVEAAEAPPAPVAPPPPAIEPPRAAEAAAPAGPVKRAPTGPLVWPQIGVARKAEPRAEPAKPSRSGDAPPTPPPREAPKQAAAAPARKPLMAEPLHLDLGSDFDGDDSVAKPEPARPQPRAVEAPKPEPARAPAAGSGVREPTRAPAPRTTMPGAGDARPKSQPNLGDSRLREIYNQYVDAKRSANESTAGITYEKLADSLRVQADKLREKHTGKNVDYEVVTKDGKTLLKPIIK